MFAYKYVRAHVEEIGDIMIELKAKHPDKEYQKILDSFFNLLVEEIDKVNTDTYELYQLSDYVPDRLRFMMNQKQLSALMFLIWEAGFIENPDRPGKTQFYNFCQTYFYCLKDRTNEFSPILDLAKKFSNIKRDDNLKVLEQVFNNIKKAYESV